MQQNLKGVISTPHRRKNNFDSNLHPETSDDDYTSPGLTRGHSEVNIKRLKLKPIMSTVINLHTAANRGRNISQEKAGQKRSNQLLAKKFKNDFQEYVKNKQDKYNVYLNPTQYQSLMHDFNFDGDDELLKSSFELVKLNVNLVHRISIYNFLCYLQQMDSLVELPRKLTNAIQKKQVGYIHKEIFYADKKDSQKIYKQYQGLLLNKLSTSKSVKKIVPTRSFSFKPEINKKSSLMGRRSNSTDLHEDFQRKQQRIQQKIQEKIEKEMKEFTFSPNISPSRKRISVKVKVVKIKTFEPIFTNQHYIETISPTKFEVLEQEIPEPLEAPLQIHLQEIPVEIPSPTPWVEEIEIEKVQVIFKEEFNLENLIQANFEDIDYYSDMVQS